MEKKATGSVSPEKKKPLKKLTRYIAAAGWIYGFYCKGYVCILEIDMSHHCPYLTLMKGGWMDKGEIYSTWLKRAGWCGFCGSVLRLCGLLSIPLITT